MNRYRSYGTLDDAPDIVGDVPSGALDMRADPSLLAPGMVRVSQNFRTSDAGRQVRGGIALQFPPGSTVASVRHAAVYRPDASNDRIALVAADKLVLFNPADQTLTSYNYPGGETVGATDPVDFLQGGLGAGTTPTAWILRGTGKTALKFDGTTVAVDAAFKAGTFGIFTQDRMAVASAAQEVSTSDFLDFATWGLLNQFKILQGSDDALRGLLAYKDGYVVIGCRKRFFLAYFAPQIGLAGYEGALNVRDSTLSDLTRAAGLVGRRTLIEAGGLVWFLSDQAIYAFAPQLDNELTVLGDPVSGPIEPVLKNLSAGYAQGSDFKQFGNRIYCAMPISDDPVKILGVVFDGAAATIETAAGHGLAVGERVQHTGSMVASLNGLHTVTGVIDATHYTVASAAAPSAKPGARLRMQRLATRNNVVAVFNLNIKGWESIDRLPRGSYADYLLVADDAAGNRRLWLVDADVGPCLYEEGDVDEINTTTGGLRLQFRLPARLSSANYNSVAIAGLLIGRTLRWGGTARQVRAGEARLRTSDGDAGQVTVRVRTPDLNEWNGTRTFDDSREDTNVRKLAGARGLEAELEVRTTGGRPTVRTLSVEVAPSGRVEE